MGSELVPDAVDDLHVAGADLAHRARVVVDDEQRLAVGGDRHAARLGPRVDLVDDPPFLRVDLRDVALVVQRRVQVLAVAGHAEVPGAGADAADPREREVGEVDDGDVGGAHDRDVGRPGVRRDGDAARVRAEVDALDDLAGVDVDDGEAVRAPVAHQQVLLVGRDGQVLGHLADLDDLVDLEVGERDPVDVAVGGSARRAGVVALDEAAARTSSTARCRRSARPA